MCVYNIYIFNNFPTVHFQIISMFCSKIITVLFTKIITMLFDRICHKDMLRFYFTFVNQAFVIPVEIKLRGRVRLARPWATSTTPIASFAVRAAGRYVGRLFTMYTGGCTAKKIT